MKSKTGIFIAIIFLFMIGAKAQKDQVIHITFTLTSAVLPEDSSVFITGGIEQLGNWNPGKIKMTYNGIMYGAPRLH